MTILSLLEAKFCQIQAKFGPNWPNDIFTLKNSGFLIEFNGIKVYTSKIYAMANILSMTAKKRPQKGPKRDKNGPNSLKNKLFSKFSVSFASLKKCFFTLISQLKLMIFYGTLKKSWSEDIQMSKECLNLGQKSSSCKNKLFSKFSVGFAPH